jgi:hypothetical protein
LYALFLALDANFRMKRKDVSSEADNPSLGDGIAFFSQVDEYMVHLDKHWDVEQEVNPHYSLKHGPPNVEWIEKHVCRS